ncbi:MAG: hypothetical protein KI790_04655 [Cyclobacteriaceae bacterium]|nr:hypothetical protein [Cyclobacteriaceae bacterium HetDA_MAG_MS6]
MKIRPLHIYVLVSAVSLIVIGYSVYYLLGGFDKIKVYQIEGGKWSVAGQYFEGEYSPRTIESYFERARDLILEKRMEGTLCVVNYYTDDMGEDNVKLFVGVMLGKDMTEIPQGFEVREFEAEKKLAVFLSMHPLVRPTPPKIHGLIFGEAQELNVQLQDYFFELYYQDNSMSIEGFTAKVD